MRNSSVLVLLFLAALSGAPALHAQEAGAPHGQEGGPRREAPPQAASHKTLLPADAVTEHEITVGGRKLVYTATAGTLVLRDDQGDATAEIFYTSFTRSDAGDAQHRPITYLFNGGPGAASAYLDIGAVGPRSLQFPGDGTPVPESPLVADNPDTWLPFTDLVFLDPVGTGYSRATDPDKAAKEFWGVQPDLTALADMIRLHLTKAGRLTSPIYLAGESYGGFRAARLAHSLATEDGIAPAGIIMISPVIEFGLMLGGPLSPLPWALRLPSYAASQLGAKALDPGALDEAENFALHDYLVALAAGPRAGPAATALYAKLAQMTGIDADLIAGWRGRIPLDEFLGELRDREGRVVSAYDATVSEVDPNPLDSSAHDDPVLNATIAPFTSAFTAYVQGELGFKTDRPFALLSREVGQHWDWGGGRFAIRNVGASDALRRALALQPKLKVMIAHGVNDLETPYMMSRYIKEHMPDALGDRIALKLYAGGHMLYLRGDSRHRLHDDAAAFYGAETAAPN